jgi:hypothetical protein
MTTLLHDPQIFTQTTNQVGYVQTSDLLECLEDYFAGTLDNVNLSVLPYETREWAFENSLWGQVDSSTMSSTLKELPVPLRAAIVYTHTQDLTALARLQSYHQESQRTFLDCIHTWYAQALHELGEAIRRDL